MRWSLYFPGHCGACE